jgi:hypothetical protein
MSDYGYKSSTEVGPGKSGGKFGLNQGAFITKFQYNPNGGQGGAQQDAIDLTVQVGEKEYMTRFFPVGKVYASSKNGGRELTDPNTQEYKDERKKLVDLFNATLSDIVACFQPEEVIQQALSTPISSFADYAQILQRLVQSTPNWNKIPVDVFLEYQTAPTGENTRTFLKLPKNVKHGQFLVRSQGPGYKEERTESHLRYIDAEGTIHPFRRTEWFVGSSFANQIVIGEEQAAVSNGAGAPTASNGGTGW